MFSVMFEVHPKSDQWDAYLGYARLLRPELEKVEGFVDNVRYKSLTRESWFFSLSGWRDEKALVRWRTQAVHHGVQEKGRFEVFEDYHLRVGQVTQDTRLPDGHTLQEQRLDETEAGAGTAVTLLDASRAPEWVSTQTPQAIAAWLGLDAAADLAGQGLLAWDVFDAVLAPGNVLLLLSWRDATAAGRFAQAHRTGEGVRLRQVRVVRDYGMFDRRESPQYYPEVQRPGG